jgi:hypothetical protein
MWWDALGFRLCWHGDHYERLFEPKLAGDLKEYEIFWIKHIVPLTNRIDSRISQLDPRWIMLRPGLPRLLDLFCESHYSAAFYYCRACSLIDSAEQMPESIFAVLRMSSYNLFRLLKICDKLFATLGYPYRRFTHLTDAAPIWGTITLYRDLLLKNPVPGRARHIQPNSLPRESVIRQIVDAKTKGDKIFTWQEAQQLSDGDFINATDLISGCRTNWADELNRIWRTVDTLLSCYRNNIALLLYMGLDSTTHVPGDTGKVSLYLDVSAPPAPSGTS